MIRGTFDRVIRYPIWFGILLLLIGFPVHLLSIKSMQSFGVESAQLFRPTSATLTVSGITSAGVSSELLLSGVHMLYGGVATLGLLATIGGCVSIVLGATLVRREALATYATFMITTVSKPQRALTLTVCAGFAYGMIVSPSFRNGVIALSAFTAASVPAFIVSLLGVLRVERRATPVTRVVVAGPLTVAAGLLSLVVGGFASPATATFMRGITSDIVRFLLLEVLSPIGLNRILTSTFELEGVGFLFVWLGINIGLGIVYGMASLRYQRLSVSYAFQQIRHR